MLKTSIFLKHVNKIPMKLSLCSTVEQKLKVLNKLKGLFLFYQLFLESNLSICFGDWTQAALRGAIKFSLQQKTLNFLVRKKKFSRLGPSRIPRHNNLKIIERQITTYFTYIPPFYHRIWLPCVLATNFDRPENTNISPWDYLDIKIPLE